MPDNNSKITELVLKYESDQKKSLSHRLDQSLPLDTESWRRVEQLLSYLTEFAPSYKVVELADAIGKFADHQAKAGYILGQRDLVKELSQKIA